MSVNWQIINITDKKKRMIFHCLKLSMLKVSITFDSLIFLRGIKEIKQEIATLLNYFALFILYCVRGSTLLDFSFTLSPSSLRIMGKVMISFQRLLLDLYVHR